MNLSHFANSDDVVLLRQPAEPTRRPFLVFIRSGATPVPQAQWHLDAPDRRFDLMVNFFEPPAPECWLARGADYLAGGGLSKFHAAKRLLVPDLLEAYAGVFLLDDDVEVFFDPAAFGDFALERGLGIAQASLTPDSVAKWRITINHPSCAWRETNFVEVMAPFFTRPALAEAVADFDSSISSYGLDLRWGQRLAKHRMAVVDLFLMAHRKPVDLADGPFYRYLRSRGVDPELELTRTMQDLGISQYKLTTHRAVFLEQGFAARVAGGQ